MLARSTLSGILLCILVPTPGEAPMRRLSILALWIVPFCVLAVGLSGCAGSDSNSDKKRNTGANTNPDKNGADGANGPNAGEVRRIVILTNGESPFWDAARQGLMRAQLDRILGTPGLSRNTYEMVSKSLAE